MSEQEAPKKTTLPMSPELMREFFEDKEKLFLVDYAGCELKGNVFLTYLSNLGLKSELDFEGAASEEKIELLKNYMTSRHIVECRTLSFAALQAVLAYKNAPEELSSLVEPVLTEEELGRFLDENKDLVYHWALFLDSCLVFLMSSFKELGEALDLKEHYEEVDDQRFVGLNIVNMFSIDGFFEIYFSLPLMPMKYFTRQFEEYMFNGKNLFYYFQTEENTLLKLLYGMLNQEIELDTLAQALGAK